MVSINNVINNTVGASNSGQTNTFTVTNSSNTASSAARETITVGGGTAADPTLNFNVSGVTNWEVGIDNSDSDAFVLAQGTALGTNNVIHSNTSGQINYPLQPCFLAYVNPAVTNVTGDGTTYTILYNNEVFDQSSSFDTTTGTFTAPITGKYTFHAVYEVTQTAAANQNSIFDLVTSNRGYELSVLNPSVATSALGFLSAGASVIADMDAADTATTTLQITGGAKVVDVTGLQPGPTNHFSGTLTC